MKDHAYQRREARCFRMTWLLAALVLSGWAHIIDRSLDVLAECEFCEVQRADD